MNSDKENSENFENSENSENLKKTDEVNFCETGEIKQKSNCANEDDFSDERTVPIRTETPLEKLDCPVDRNTNIWARTVPYDKIPSGRDIHELLGKYMAVMRSREIAPPANLTLNGWVGWGTQGVVYYGERHSSDGFCLPVALKFLSPDGFTSDEEYYYMMNYHARVALKIAQIQHEYLVGVRNWFTLNDVRMMEMEWVDGYDLLRLTNNETLRWMKKNMIPDVYQRATDVILTSGPAYPRFKPGVALSMIRECLCALSALHLEGVMHGDIKPANIMLKKSGHVKIIDVGAAFFINETPPRYLCTPYYAAPEVLKPNNGLTPQADIASLGYVLIELIAGRPPFENYKENGQHKKWTVPELLRQKLNIVDRLADLLPPDVLQNRDLVDLCRRMVHPDLNVRFKTAQDAITSGGVAEILRSLIRYGLASEYDLDLGGWIRQLKLPPFKQKQTEEGNS